MDNKITYPKYNFLPQVLSTLSQLDMIFCKQKILILSCVFAVLRFELRALHLFCAEFLQGIDQID
jgi:hypothetical protein